MQKNIKIIIWGLGAMGTGMADLLLSKKGVEIAGIAGRSSKVGKSIYDYLSVERNGRPEVIIKNYHEVITEKAADVVLLCTGSTTEAIYHHIAYILEKKINVITCAEEMTYPFAGNAELARRLDAIAKRNGVSVLGAGINPGFVLDLLVIVLSSCCYQIDHISARRAASLTPFGPTVLRAHGIGLKKEAFYEALSNGSISGHTGFTQSLTMIADALGWKLDSISQSVEPIVSSAVRRAPYGTAEAGTVAGTRSKGQGYSGGKLKIELDHPTQLEAWQFGVKTGDSISIRGTPNISFENIPEIPGGIGTIALCVNMIPHIINAPAGVQTMLDLPVPHAILGDMRDYVREEARVVT